jgi:hypothetical protein
MLFLGDVETFLAASDAVRNATAEATVRYDRREGREEEATSSAAIVRWLWKAIRGERR